MKQVNSKKLLCEVNESPRFQNFVLIYIASLLEEMLRLQRRKSRERRSK